MENTPSKGISFWTSANLASMVLLWAKDIIVSSDVLRVPRSVGVDVDSEIAPGNNILVLRASITSPALLKIIVMS